MTKRVAGPGSDDYGVEIDFQYLAGKTIRTVELFLQPLNSVSDLAGEICKVTLNGPIEQGLTTTVYTELWNRKEHNVEKAVFKGFILHFADGTAEFYKESDISSKRTLTANSSAPTTPPRNTSGGSGGCYIATCVYGSYDCPQVWTLRRFRDGTLGATWYGRLFIRFYYAISPTLVRWFGKTKWFKKLWKNRLDRMIAKLRLKGVEDPPYEDERW